MSTSFSYTQYTYNHTQTHTRTQTRRQSTFRATVLFSVCIHLLKCQSTSVFAGGTIHTKIIHLLINKYSTYYRSFQGRSVLFCVCVSACVCMDRTQTGIMHTLAHAHLHYKYMTPFKTSLGYFKAFFFLVDSHARSQNFQNTFQYFSPNFLHGSLAIRAHTL